MGIKPYRFPQFERYMPLLYYWRGDNYRRDLDYGAGFHLNQANLLLHEVDIGDSLWAFTRRRDGVYVLAAELVIKAKTINPPGFRYGRYRVWGDLERSRYFLTEGQPGIEQVIRHLSVRAGADVLGRSFQGHAAVRAITEEDHRILAEVASDLPLEPRARLVPEERLEAALLLGDEDAMKELLREERPGLAEARREYLFSSAPTRNRELARRLQQMYEGRCQVCRWDPLDAYDCALCQGHHIHWLSRGGEDDITNMALLCPNHHNAVHGVDAQFDYKDMAFVFPTHRETLALNLHLS